MGSHEHMIKSIVTEYHWLPHQIDNLYCDDLDHHGIVYWFDTLKEMHSKLKSKK